MMKIPSIKNWISSRGYEMHYKNGREAKLGDIVTGLQYQKRIIGVLVRIYEGAAACSGVLSTNLNVIPFAGSSVIFPALLDEWNTVATAIVSLQECLHIEDFVKDLIPDPVVTTEGSSLSTL